jgi:alcohol dehydrogenase class IV
MSVPPIADYRLTLPARVRFGWGARRDVADLARPLGRRAWIVCGSRTLLDSGVVNELRDHLATADIPAELLGTISREPLVSDVDDLLPRLRRDMADGDFLIPLGGGAAIDLAKALAALATNQQGASVRDYLEGVGRGLTLDAPPLPLLAIPTTAGTGSEATRNAVISSLDLPFKKSLRDERLVPAAVLIDPELTVSNPPSVTSHSGMDAITQLIESLLTRKANPFTSALCLDGLHRAIPALPVAVANPADRAAREAMAHAAFLSGVALANSGLGLAHGVAAALGVHCGVPHGLACAVMLPTALRYNRDVRIEQVAAVGRIITGDDTLADDPAADAAIAGIERLCRAVGIPSSLSALGVRRELLSTLAAASRGNSLSGNPRDVSDAQLVALLEPLCHA